MQDLTSTNGTKLKRRGVEEAERVSRLGEGAEPTRLQAGDSLIVGSTMICLREGPIPTAKPVRIH